MPLIKKKSVSRWLLISLSKSLQVWTNFHCLFKVCLVKSQFINKEDKNFPISPTSIFVISSSILKCMGSKKEEKWLIRDYCTSLHDVTLAFFFSLYTVALTSNIHFNKHWILDLHRFIVQLAEKYMYGIDWQRRMKTSLFCYCFTKLVALFAFPSCHQKFPVIPVGGSNNTKAAEAMGRQM